MFKNANLSSGAARSVIRGRRLGRPLLGKWHLCSFVVSVIGLPALSADSSPREAPPACQLRSIRRPGLLLFTVPPPSLTQLCLLIYIQRKLVRDLFYPLDYLRQNTPSILPFFSLVFSIHKCSSLRLFLQFQPEL